MLIEAIINDDSKAVRGLIQKNPRLLECRMRIADNGTPLTIAAWNDSSKVAAKLIELGADIESEDFNWHNTPLRWCCWWGNADVAEVLINAGAQTKGAGKMAQSAKASNKSPKGLPEDFDKISSLIDALQAESP